MTNKKLSVEKRKLLKTDKSSTKKPRSISINEPLDFDHIRLILDSFELAQKAIQKYLQSYPLSKLQIATQLGYKSPSTFYIHLEKGQFTIEELKHIVNFLEKRSV